MARTIREALVLAFIGAVLLGAARPVRAAVDEVLTPSALDSWSRAVTAALADCRVGVPVPREVADGVVGMAALEVLGGRAERGVRLAQDLAARLRGGGPGDAQSLAAAQTFLATAHDAAGSRSQAEEARARATRLHASLAPAAQASVELLANLLDQVGRNLADRAVGASLPPGELARPLDLPAFKSRVNGLEKTSQALSAVSAQIDRAKGLASRHTPPEARDAFVRESVTCLEDLNERRAWLVRFLAELDATREPAIQKFRASQRAPLAAVVGQMDTAARLFLARIFLIPLQMTLRGQRSGDVAKTERHEAPAEAYRAPAARPFDPKDLQEMGRGVEALLDAVTDAQEVQRGPADALLGLAAMYVLNGQFDGAQRLAERLGRRCSAAGLGACKVALSRALTNAAAGRGRDAREGIARAEALLADVPRLDTGTLPPTARLYARILRLGGAREAARAFEDFAGRLAPGEPWPETERRKRPITIGTLQERAAVLQEAPKALEAVQDGLKRADRLDSPGARHASLQERSQFEREALERLDALTLARERLEGFIADLDGSTDPAVGTFRKSQRAALVDLVAAIDTVPPGFLGRVFLIRVRQALSPRR